MRIILENYERTGKLYIYAKKGKNPYNNENTKIVRNAKATCVNMRVYKNYKLSNAATKQSESCKKEQEL